MKPTTEPKFTRNKRLQLSLKHLDQSREDLRKRTDRLKDSNDRLAKVLG